MGPRQNQHACMIRLRVIHIETIWREYGISSVRTYTSLSASVAASRAMLSTLMDEVSCFRDHNHLAVTAI